MAIILLDLNHTLVANSEEKRSPFTKQIEQEIYRAWLPSLFKEDHQIILITARPEKYVEQTLESLRTKIGFIPDDYYFNSFDLPPHHLKKRIVTELIFPKYGNEPSNYIAVESNPKTVAVYRELGITQAMKIV